MQLTEDLLLESSTEARLERIQGLSRDNITRFLNDLWWSIVKESSEEKKNKLRMVYWEIY